MPHLKAAVVTGLVSGLQGAWVALVAAAAGRATWSCFCYIVLGTVVDPFPVADPFRDQIALLVGAGSAVASAVVKYHISNLDEALMTFEEEAREASRTEGIPISFPAFVDLRKKHLAFKTHTS